MTGNDNESASIRIEARAWLIKLRSREADDQLRAAFEHWQASSPDNQAAYEREAAAFSSMSTIKMSEEFGHNGNWRKSPTRGWLKVGAIAAAVGAVLVAVFAGTAFYNRAPQDGLSRSFAFQPFSTQRGEIRVFRLTDGSLATLDTESKVEISITDERRLLRLTQGRARFELAAGKRPFTVQAGAGEIVANAASFDLAFDGQNRVTVQLLGGSAIVRPRPHFASFALKPQNLTLGTSFAYAADDFTKLTGLDYQPKMDKDWPTGWVEFESIRLDNLIVQANDYADKPIRLADPMLGSLQVSGRFRISDTNGFVTRICTLFDLLAVAEQDAIYLRKP